MPDRFNMPPKPQPEVTTYTDPEFGEEYEVETWDVGATMLPWFEWQVAAWQVCNDEIEAVVTYWLGEELNPEAIMTRLQWQIDRLEPLCNENLHPDGWTWATRDEHST